MIDVRSIPFGTRGAIDGPIRAEEGRGQKGRDREKEKERTSIHEAFLVGRKRDDGSEEKERERGTSVVREIGAPCMGEGFRGDVLMVLEIENAPGQPKWVWLPSLVPIVSVG